MNTVETEFDFLRDIAADLSGGEISFPTAAAATQRIQKALKNPDIPVSDLAEALEQEPLVALRLVKMANSVGNRGSMSRFSDVRTAIACLGMNTVRTVAMSVVVDQLRAMTQSQCLPGYADAVWQHSVNVAAHASVLTADLTTLSRDEAMFAGLVHDIGHFYLLWRLSKYEALARDPVAVRRILATWHAPIGAALLRDFDLPDGIAEAVAQHEEAGGQAPLQSYGDILNVANQCAAATNPALASPPDEYDLAVDVLEVLTERDGDIRGLKNALE